MSTKRTSRFGANVVADIDKRKRESSGYGYLNLPKNVSMFKEKPGKVLLDIIPYIVSDEHHLDRNADNEFAANVGNPWYKKPIWVHSGVGADKQRVICPAKTLGKKCPICEEREKQKSEGMDKDTPGFISYPQLRNLYVVTPIGAKEYDDDEMYVWEISNGNFQKVLDEEIAENPENGVFPDPEGGKSLLVRFTEATFGKNKYCEATRIDFEDRDDYDPKIMDKAPNLDEIVKIQTYKELSALFFEIGADDEEDKPKKKRGGDDEDVSSFRKKKTVIKEEEVEEEEEAPRRKTSEKKDDDHPFEKRSKKTAEPEEEEEEKPRRRLAAKEEEPIRRRRSEPEEEERPLRKKAAPVEEEEEEEDVTPKKTSTMKRRVVEEEEEEEVPVKKKDVGKTMTSPSKGYECPSDHKFGKDWSDYDDCDNCPLFSICGKENERLRKAS